MAPWPAGARNDDGQATPPAGTFTQIDAGYQSNCGLKSDGTLACWGDNTYGQSHAARRHLHPGQHGLCPQLRG